MSFQRCVRQFVNSHLKYNLARTTQNALRLSCNLYSTEPAAASDAAAINFNNKNLQKYLEQLRQEFYALRVEASGNAKTHARVNQLNEVVSALEKYRVLQCNLISKEEVDNEKDEDMRELMQEENEVYKALLQQTEQELISQLLLLADDARYPAVIFEVNAGAGGQEAMLFAKDLLQMYLHYFDYHGWDYDVLVEDCSDIGGLRHANVIVNDANAYDVLRFEAGVHRVQRVPATEKSGRIHTSTASVTVIPRTEDIEINIQEKDLKIETKRASGAGGQHVNTTDSAVRIVHLPTGIAIENQTERSQLKNREIALKRLQAKLIQQQLQRSEASKIAAKKAQQGNLNRNEKIRTYNFVQDRVTDHRIPDGTMHDLEVILKGGERLDSLVQRIVKENRKTKLLERIANFVESK